jgi:hypothetical protein
MDIQGVWCGSSPRTEVAHAENVASRHRLTLAEQPGLAGRTGAEVRGVDAGVGDWETCRAGAVPVLDG